MPVRDFLERFRKSKRHRKKLKKKKRVKREPIRIVGHHAKVVEITKKGSLLKGSIRRVAHYGPIPALGARYNLSHTLAHLFFPRNFFEVIATSTDLLKVYSKRAKISPASQKAIEAYYQVERGEISLTEFNKLTKEHEKRAKAIDFEAFKEAGIMPQTHAGNIGFRLGTPVFFEISFVHIGKLETFARKIRDPLKKRQALDIIRELKKHSKKKNDWVHAHTA